MRTSTSLSYVGFDDLLSLMKTRRWVIDSLRCRYHDGTDKEINVKIAWRGRGDKTSTLLVLVKSKGCDYAEEFPAPEGVSSKVWLEIVAIELEEWLRLANFFMIRTVKLDPEHCPIEFDLVRMTS